jgi:hypothetical protein
MYMYTYMYPYMRGYMCMCIFSDLKFVHVHEVTGSCRTDRQTKDRQTYRWTDRQI